MVFHKLSICHSFLLLCEFSDNLFHFTTECPRLLQSFVLFSGPIMRTVFLRIYLSCLKFNCLSHMVLVLHIDSVYVTVFTTYSVFCVSQICKVRTGSSLRTSQGRSGPTSLFLSVFIFWGFSH